MQCSEVQLDLGRYIDQELPPSNEEGIATHLLTCPACRQEMLAVEALYQLLEQATPLPTDFTSQVMRRVRAEQVANRGLVWPWLRGRWSRTTYLSLGYALSTASLVWLGNRFILHGELWGTLSAMGGRMNGLLTGSALYVYEMVRVYLG